MCGYCGTAFKPEDELERGYCTRCLKSFWWAKMWLSRFTFKGDYKDIKKSEYDKLGEIVGDIEMSLLMGKKLWHHG